MLEDNIELREKASVLLPDTVVPLKSHFKNAEWVAGGLAPEILREILTQAGSSHDEISNDEITFANSWCDLFMAAPIQSLRLATNDYSIVSFAVVEVFC